MSDAPEKLSERRYSRRQLGALIALIASAAAASIVLRKEASLGVDIAGQPIVKKIHNDRLSPQIAPLAADVSLAVFTDYRCPVCRRSDEALLAAAAEDGRVRIVFKEWPIFGPLSRQAAIVALMADRQGIYAPVRQAMLAAPSLSTGVFQQVVEQAGGVWQPIQAELVELGAKTRQQLQVARNDAFALGLSGTPGYLIGPILVKGALSAAEVRRTLAIARDAQSSER